MSQLTQEQKRVKLAEWAGWSSIHEAASLSIPYHWGGNPHGQREVLPDYFRSLDGVHLL